ncbi:MAG TPA: hypothetical protein G4O11_02040 [Anaerolineae bacterium]|nr:hypothetical protein [Anaerolineae bacterium]
MTPTLGHVILSPSAEPKVPSEAEGLRTDSAKDPYDETLETVESQGFSPFGYDIVAPNGAQNDIYEPDILTRNLENRR